MSSMATVSRVIISMSVVLSLTAQTALGLSHVDTTYQDFYDDGAPDRFKDTVVVNGSVSLEWADGSWEQSDWSLGPGFSVWGGQNGYHNGDAIEYNTTGAIGLWPRYGHWDRVDDMPLDLMGSAMVWVGDRFILTGGLGSGGMSESTYAYFIETDTWQKRANSPIKLYGHASAWNGHHVYVMGDTGFMDSVHRYDVGLNSWETLTVAPFKRYEHTMVAIDDENLLVFGGKNGTGEIMDELWGYNTTTASWVKLTSGPKPVFGHTAIWDNASKNMLVAGGMGSAGYSWDVYTYSPKDDQWTATRHLPNSRVDHSMVWSPEDDTAIVFGGEGGGYLDDVFVYDKVADEWPLGVLGPSGRSGHSAAWGGGGMVVAGGRDDPGYKNETWVYRYYENRTDGWLVSPQVDIGMNVDLIGFEYDAEIPSGTRIEVQLATNTDHQTWDYLGPDGTNATRYLVPSDVGIPDVHDGDRYFRYRLFLETDDTNVTPMLRSIKIKYRSYKIPGTFVSRVIDLKTNDVTIDLFSWDEQRPSGTEIKMFLTSSPNMDMSAPTMFNRSVGKDATITANLSRYLRYEARLITVDTYRTPVLEAVKIQYSSEPRLSKGSVDPVKGNITTTFQFSVEYIDLDGRPPTIAQVVVDGVAHDMGTPDSDMSDGAVFDHSMGLPAGGHSYFFNFRVADRNLRLPASGTYPGPQVDPINLPPVAVITLPGDGSVFEVGQNIRLMGEKSYDPDGDDLRFRWSSDLSGLISEEPNTNVTLPMGEHALTLMVSDTSGDWDSATVKVTVLTAGANTVPVVLIAEGDFIKKVGEALVIDATKSHDPDGTIVQWSFDWGDGSGVLDQTHGTASHIYDTQGSYLVKVSVKDNRGATNQTTISVIIEPKGSGVEPPPPDYTTSVAGGLLLVIPIIIIIVAIALAFMMARKSRY